MTTKKEALDKKANAEASVSKAAMAKKSSGQMLRKARLVKGYKVAQVVQKLNISEDYVKAIENSEFKKLPPEPTYTLGFVRAYAQLVDLDSGEIVNLFKSELLGLEAPTENMNILTAPLPKSRSTLAFVYIALAAGTLILSMGYFANQKTHASASSVATVQ